MREFYKQNIQQHGGLYGGVGIGEDFPPFLLAEDFFHHWRVEWYCLIPLICCRPSRYGAFCLFGANSRGFSGHVEGCWRTVGRGGNLPHQLLLQGLPTGSNSKVYILYWRLGPSTLCWCKHCTIKMCFCKSNQKPLMAQALKMLGKYVLFIFVGNFSFGQINNKEEGPWNKWCFSILYFPNMVFSDKSYSKVRKEHIREDQMMEEDREKLLPNLFCCSF